MTLLRTGALRDVYYRRINNTVCMRPCFLNTASARLYVPECLRQQNTSLVFQMCILEAVPIRRFQTHPIHGVAHLALLNTCTFQQCHGLIMQIRQCAQCSPQQNLKSVIPTPPCTLLEHSLSAQHFPRLISQGFSFILLKQKHSSH